MTEYSDIVEKERERFRIEKEAKRWAQGVKYIHLNNGVIETKYNNGDVHYEETKEEGKSWTIFRDLDLKKIIEKFIRSKSSIKSNT